MVLNTVLNVIYHTHSYKICNEFALKPLRICYLYVKTVLKEKHIVEYR